jgi:hypothetical protein
MNLLLNPQLNLKNNSKHGRKRLFCLTFLELMIVVSLIAGISSVMMVPVWRGWKNLQLRGQEQQIQGFFKEIYVLLLMSQSEMKLELQESEGRQRLVATGFLLEDRPETIKLVLDKGIHFKAAGISVDKSSWVLSVSAAPQELTLEVTDGSDRFRKWKERVYLWGTK